MTDAQILMNYIYIPDFIFYETVERNKPTIVIVPSSRKGPSAQNANMAIFDNFLALAKQRQSPPLI